MAGWSSEGDDSVKADEGPDDEAIIIAAPTRAAAKPAGMRRKVIVSSRLPNLVVRKHHSP